MKTFILELGKDFLFMESEYGVQVGGSTKRIDLLFYHRALQCLIAIELFEMIKLDDLSRMIFR